MTGSVTVAFASGDMGRAFDVTVSPVVGGRMGQGDDSNAVNEECRDEPYGAGA